MIFINNIVKFLKKYILLDPIPKKLALSFCVANFVAFSPFLGLHTVMIFIFGWLFSLNLPLMLAVVHTINNPWTAIPIYTLDYVFGRWLLMHFVTIDLTLFTPEWLLSIEKMCAQCIGVSDLSFWAFFIGGNVLGILMSIACYPLILRFFEKTITHSRQVYTV